MNFDSPTAGSGGTTNNTGGAIEEGTPELVVQYESVETGNAPSANEPKVATIKQPLTKPASTLTAFSWSLIFD